MSRTDDIILALSLLHGEGAISELRACKNSGVISGFFNNAIWRIVIRGLCHKSHCIGFLKKCPETSFIDRTDVIEGGDTSQKKKVNISDHYLIETNNELKMKFTKMANGYPHRRSDVKEQIYVMRPVRRGA